MEDYLQQINRYKESILKFQSRVHLKPQLLDTLLEIDRSLDEIRVWQQNLKHIMSKEKLIEVDISEIDQCLTKIEENCTTIQRLIQSQKENLGALLLIYPSIQNLGESPKYLTNIKPSYNKEVYKYSPEISHFFRIPESKLISLMVQLDMLGDPFIAPETEIVHSTDNAFYTLSQIMGLLGIQINGDVLYENKPTSITYLEKYAELLHISLVKYERLLTNQAFSQEFKIGMDGLDWMKNQFTNKKISEIKLRGLVGMKKGIRDMNKFIESLNVD